MEFIFDRLRDKNPDGSIQIMYTIHGPQPAIPFRHPSLNMFLGGKELVELELTHLDGHKGSKPVRYGLRHLMLRQV
jgi:hypothetical protein